jgi:hypothetical protein
MMGFSLTSKLCSLSRWQNNTHLLLCRFSFGLERGATGVSWARGQLTRSITELRIPLLLFATAGIAVGTRIRRSSRLLLFLLLLLQFFLTTVMSRSCWFCTTAITITAAAAAACFFASTPHTCQLHNCKIND